MLKRLKLFVYIAIFSFVWHGFVFFQPIAYSEDSLEKTIARENIDCSDLSVHYVDDPSLTLEERLHLMDKAFLESLKKFELCQSLKEMGKSSSAAAVNEDGVTDDSGDSALETEGSASGGSIADSTMSGTEPDKTIPPAARFEKKETDGLNSSQNKNETGSQVGGKMQRSNGKLPEDIPPAQNDDALAAQIRYAAENETDPVKSRQLWNEYRKYKGLPTK